MRNSFAGLLVICGTALSAVSIAAGAFLIGRLLGMLPVINNSNDDYFIWLWLFSIVLTVAGLWFGIGLIGRGTVEHRALGTSHPDAR
jgi:hypothetical protein